MDAPLETKPMSFTVDAVMCDEATAFIERRVTVQVDVASEGSPLAELRTAVGTALEVDGALAITVARDGDDNVPLTTDSAVREAVGAAEGKLELRVTRIQKSATRQQAMQVFEEGAIAGDVLDFNFDFSLNQENILEALKQEIRGEFELNEALDLSAVVDGETSPVPSDRALINLLHYLTDANRNAEPLVLTFKRASAPAKVTTFTLHASLTDDLTAADHAVQFKYSPNVSGLVEALKQELRGELELDPAVDIEVAAEVDGDATLIVSDAAASGLFDHLISESILEIRVKVSQKRRVPSQVIQIEATKTGGTESVTANFAFEYRLDDEKILEAVTQEVRGELELDAIAKLEIIYIVEGDDVALTADKQFREILAHNPTQPLQLKVQQMETVAKGRRDFTLHVAHDGEEGSVTVTVDPETDTLLTDVVTHLKEDLDVDGEVALQHTSERGEAQVVSDEQLRSLLESSRPPGTFELVALPKRIPRNLTLIHKSGDETLEIPFTYHFDDEAPRELLTDAVRDAIGKDKIVVGVLIEGENVLVTNDRIAREVFASVSGRVSVTVSEGAVETGVPPATVKGTPAKSAPAATVASTSSTTTIECHFQQTNEDARFLFTYNLEQEALLESLKQEIRGEFDVLDNMPLSLIVTLPESSDPIPVDSDNRLRQILSQDPAPPSVLHVHASEFLRPVTKTVNIHLVVSGDEGNFDFKYTVGQDGLFSTLSQECFAAADTQASSETHKLVASISGDAVELVSDKQLEDIFPLYFQGGALNIDILPRGERTHTQTVEFDCYFEGTIIKGTFKFHHNQTDGLLDALKQECRHELDLSPDEPVTLLIKPEFEDEEIMLHNDAAVRQLLDSIRSKAPVPRLALHLETGALPGTVSAVVQCEVREEDDRSSNRGIAFSIHLNSDRSDVLLDLKHKVREVFRTPNDAFVSLSYISLLDGDSVPLISDDQIISVIRSGFSDVLQLRVKFSAAPPSSTLVTQARAAEVAAMCTELRVILEDRNVVTATDLKPLFGTFQPHGEALDATDLFVQKYDELVLRDRSIQFDMFAAELEEWTAHWDSELLFKLCYHCRNTIDMLVAISPASKTRRYVASAFKAQAVNGSVAREQLLEALIASNFVDPDDVDTTLATYGPRLSETEFGEIMTYFFAENPNRIHTVFSIATLRRPLSAGKTRASREVDALRKTRLKSEVRHSLDGLQPASLQLFLEHHGEANDAWHKELIFCVAALMRLPSASDESREDTWSWFCETARSADAGAALLNQMRGTSRSYASEGVIAHVASIILSNALTPSILLITSNVLSAFAEWVVKVAQLTCVVNRQPWPPVTTTAAPEPGSEPGSPPSKIQTSPPRSRIQPSPPVHTPSRNIVQRYTYKHSHMTEGLNLSERPNPTPLSTLLAESRAETSAEETQEEAPAAAATEKQEEAPAAAATDKQEEAPAAAATEEKQEKAPTAAATEEKQEAPAAAATEEKQEAPAAAATEEKQEEAPAAAATEEKQEQAPAAAATEEKQDDKAPAAAATEEKQEEAPAAAATEEKQEEAPAAAATEEKQEQAPAAAATEEKQDSTMQ
jgi:hypothetical protein